MNISAKNMIGKIDGLLYAEVAENIVSGTYDFVYYSEFSSAKALEDYQTHPLHQKHKQMCADWVESREICDYEV